MNISDKYYILQADRHSGLSLHPMRFAETDLPVDRHSGLSLRRCDSQGQALIGELCACPGGSESVQAKVFVDFPVGYGLVIAFPFVYLVLHE